MPKPLGRHAPRLTEIRSLKTVKGRREHGQFAFEGATLLHEALAAGVQPESVYVTPAAFAATPEVRDLDASGVDVYTLDESLAAALSDVATPSGIVAVATMRIATIPAMLARAGLLLVLADLNDPGNAGTLLRSAEAFGATGVVFGRTGVDPYHPKVVRAAMGSLFRVPIGIADPEELAAAVAAGGTAVIGLSAEGTPLDRIAWPERSALVVGHERRGLGRWEIACSVHAGIAMEGSVDSLNAAVAGSIALYEAAKKWVRARSSGACQ